MRYLLLIIGVVIILAILIDGWRRHRSALRQKSLNTIKLGHFDPALAQDKTTKKETTGPQLDLSKLDQLALDKKNHVAKLKEGSADNRDENANNALNYLSDSQRMETHSLPDQKNSNDHAKDNNGQTIVLPKDNFVLLFVWVPNDQPALDGYKLLQLFLANDLQLGERKFFHRYHYHHCEKNIAFSIATQNEPGYFELTKMKNFACRTLIFFMNLKKQQNAVATFDEMLTTARNLAKALNAHVGVEQNAQSTLEHIAKLRQAIDDSM